MRLKSGKRRTFAVALGSVPTKIVPRWLVLVGRIGSVLVLIAAFSAPVRLLVMSHPQFRDAVRANADLLTHVMAAMGERLRSDSLASRT